jgi:anti-sigma B factor antagonist
VQPNGLAMDVTGRDGASTVALKGELDVHSSPDLRDVLHQLLADGKRVVVIDLRDLEFVDSTGLGVLVGALKKARQSGGDIELRTPTAAIRKALEITGLTQVFRVADGS